MKFIEFPTYSTLLEALFNPLIGVVLAGVVPLGLGFLIFYLLSLVDASREDSQEEASHPAWRSLSQKRVAAISAIGGAAMWLLWLTWSPTSNSIFRTTNNTPYDVWQVVCCGVCMVLLVAIVGSLARHRLSGPMLSACCSTFSFLYLWIYWAASSGDGLFLVGAALLAAGAMMGLGLVALIVGLTRYGWTKMRRARHPNP